ncbi:MAG: acyl-CoA carboxylase subunit beta, partial [Ferruginibacter sp.]
MENIEFNKNEDELKMAWSNIKKKLEIIYEGGGIKAAKKQKERNKLTARERISYLCDEGKYFLEIGAF